MGARPLYYNDTNFKTIKYNDTIRFAAGFALFKRNDTNVINATNATNATNTTDSTDGSDGSDATNTTDTTDDSDDSDDYEFIPTNWIVTQSWSNAPFFNYQLADTVVKDGVESCDLLDEEGNCLSSSFEEETTGEIESIFDEGLQNTGSFRL